MDNQNNQSMNQYDKATQNSNKAVNVKTTQNKKNNKSPQKNQNTQCK